MESIFFTAAKVKKLHKVNILNKVFGDGVDMKETPPVQRRKVPIVKKKRYVLGLQTLCRFLLNPCYPKEAIAAAVCAVKVEEKKKSLEEKCTLQSLYVDLPFMGKKYNIYWYPEKDHILGDLLLHSLDPSHLLTYTAITQKGALGVKPEDYRVVCEAKVLHMVTIQDNLNQQNVSIAKEIFSEKVEKCLKITTRCMQYM